MKTFIYLITNCYNTPNKIYVGKTKNPNNRIKKHYTKYGDNLYFNIIDEIDSLKKEDWKPLESYWIEQFRQWGFNIQNKNNGGGGPITHSEETRLKIKKKKKNKTRPHTVEWNKKIGIKQKNKSKPHNNQWNMNIGLSLLGKKQNDSTIEKRRISNSKHIIQYDLKGNFIKEWDNGKIASKELNISYTSINHCCNNKTITSGGYIWKFKYNKK
jgi:group I intron endonuclease